MTAESHPITIVIRHPKEQPKKCSILPLKNRDDVKILNYPVANFPPLDAYFRLAADGDPLTTADSASGILLVDSCWRRAPKILQGIEHLPARSLTGFRTAFPRVSRLGTDPDNGLASVEALFLAYHILGRSTQGLLDHYRWRDEFLEINRLEE